MCPGARNSNVWILLAIIAWTARVGSAQSPMGGSVVLELRTQGWEPPVPHGINSPSIAIDHRDRVVVGFTVRERNGLVTRNQPSLSFHIVRFSPDGKADLSLSLPTNAAGSTGIYLSDTDQIIARANDNLQLLQADEGKLQNGMWKILAPCTAGCLVTQSRSRQTVHLYTENADPPVTIIRLSQQPALQRCGKASRLIKSTEDKIQNYPQLITDDFAYFAGMTGVLEVFTYPWPLCDYEHRLEMPLRVRGRWLALSDKLFVLTTYSGRKGDTDEGLEVISSDGRVTFHANLAKHESADSLWEPIRASERGDRIAAHIRTLRGGNKTLDIGSLMTARRIAVYDIEAGKEVASIPASPKYHYRFAFDLSPDGRRLAILEDDVVRVVDLDGAAKSNVH
jgi:hypothetical protein